MSNQCPICLSKPMPQIWPYCSAACLHADPDSAKDPEMQRRMKVFHERGMGAGGPGGMVSPYIDDKLAWYLLGSQDEAAFAQGVDWGVCSRPSETETEK